MLTIVSMNRAGLSDERLTFIVTFEFDNASTLPERAFNVGNMSYVLAKGSTAKNVVTGTNYEYTGSKWVKTSEITNSTSKTSTITDNGNYNVTNNDFVGFSDVTVDVSAEPPTLITKTITANDTYNASDDGADGYSSVSVDVEQASFTSVLTCIPEINTTNQNLNARWYKLINNDSSTINITEEVISKNVATEYYTVLNPLKKGTCSFNHAFGIVAFTPTEDFDGLYNSSGNKYTFTGDEVTAGDGYCYIASITEYNSTYVMKKTNRIFVNVINS